jgi:glucose-6-phosphate 1-epimerase
MTNVQDLNARFGVPGVITIDAGRNGMPRVRVTSPAAEAEIYLHGAHVTHFSPRGHKPVLFMSGQSLFDPAKAIRGGVPLIFPWFGPNAADPKAPQHGFARTTTWTVRDVQPGRGPTARTVVSLALGPTEQSRAHWPHDFEATFTVTAGASLEMALDVVNTGSAEFAFEDALHTYLAVGDIRRTTIDGLAGRTFIDKVDKAQRKTQPPARSRSRGDRPGLPRHAGHVTVNDAANGGRSSCPRAGRRRRSCGTRGSTRPRRWPTSATTSGPGMLCIETANAADNAVKLAPGARHTMRATIAVH